MVADHDIPIAGGPLPLAGRAAGRTPQHRRRNVGGRDVVARRMARLKGADGVAGLGNDDAAMLDADVRIAGFRNSRAGKIPDAELLGLYRIGFRTHAVIPCSWTAPTGSRWPRPSWHRPDTACRTHRAQQAVQ